MNFAEAMATNPPRLVVTFQHRPDGSEQFEWGVVGAIPIMTLIGYVVGVQSDLVNDEWIPECDHEPAAFVIAWDGHDLSHFMHPEIPRLSLCGMLEIIKGLLVDSRRPQTAQGGQWTSVLGPDGRPMRA